MSSGSEGGKCLRVSVMLIVFSFWRCCKSFRVSDNWSNSVIGWATVIFSITVLCEDTWIKIVVFWDVTPFWLVISNRRIRGTCASICWVREVAQIMTVSVSQCPHALAAFITWRQKLTKPPVPLAVRHGPWARAARSPGGRLPERPSFARWHLIYWARPTLSNLLFVLFCSLFVLFCC